MLMLEKKVELKKPNCNFIVNNIFFKFNFFLNFLKNVNIIIFDPKVSFN